MASPGSTAILPRLASTLGALGPEDVSLAAWVGAGQPLLRLGGFHLTGSYTDLLDRNDLLVGLVYAAAIALAVLALALRSTAVSRGEPRDDQFGLIFGPFFGGLLLLGVIAAHNLGVPGPTIVVGAGVAGLVLVVLSGRLPAETPATRRLLIEPYVFLAAALFNASMADIGPAFALGNAQAQAPGDLLAAIALSVGLVALFSSVFYAMLVYAPRQLADPQRSMVGWIGRYALFVGGVVVGSTWLRALGS